MQIILSFAIETAACERIHDIVRDKALHLTKLGVKGNFHLTGDFARALRRHARHDVVKALSKHQIGYHCNHHGGRPFMAGYCESEPWDAAVATWLAEELPGVRILEELMECKPEYYTTEYAKAPQVIYGSWLAGIPTTGILLGQGMKGQSEPLPDGGQAAAWFCNSFVPTSAYLMGVGQSMQQIIDYYAPMMAGKRALIRAFLHEYELVKDTRQPESGSNYEDTHYEDMTFGLLPDDVIAGNVAETLQAFSDMVAFPGAQLLGYADFRACYYPGQGQWLTLESVDRLAKARAESIDAMTLGEISVSPAEAVAVLVRMLREFSECGIWPGEIALRSVIGPGEEPEAGIAATRLPAASFLPRLREWDRLLDDVACLPANVEIEGNKLGPGQWLQCLARIYLALRADPSGCNEVDCPDDMMPVIAEDPFFRQTQFVRRIYPEGFTGERICRLSRLQSWSWKPAVSKEPS